MAEISGKGSAKLVVKVARGTQPVQSNKQIGGEFELIFGYGDTISKEDLFVYWNSSTKEAKCFPFKLCKSNLNPLCGSFGNEEIQRILKTEANDQVIHYLGVEEIKYYLKEQRGFLSKERIKIIEARKHPFLNKLKIKPSDINGPLRYLNVIYRLDPSVTFLTLKDVFLDHWSFTFKTYSWINEDGKETDYRLLGYNPYDVVRTFLKTMKIFFEKRKGKQRRTRYSKDEIDLIVDSYNQYKQEKSLLEVIKELSLPLPNSRQLSQLQEIVNKS